MDSTKEQTSSLKELNKDITEDTNDEEFEFINKGGENLEDDEFDRIVGTLQEIVMSLDFEQQQTQFLEKNCSLFVDEEENRMEYMSIFKEYQDKLESIIEKKLKDVIPGINMKKFFSLVESRISEVDPQLLDTLLTFTDFQLFKEDMLAQKMLRRSTLQEKEKSTESAEQDLGGLVISGKSKVIHNEKAEKEKEKKKGKEDKPKKEVSSNKENENLHRDINVEKEVASDDLSKHAQKKTSSKAAPQKNVLA